MFLTWRKPPGGNFISAAGNTCTCCGKQTFDAQCRCFYLIGPFLGQSKGTARRPLRGALLWRFARGHFRQIRKFSWVKREGVCLWGATCFMRGSYLDSVIGLLVNDGDVAPLQQHHDINHGFDLIQVWRDGPREVLEALFVAQLRTGWEVRDLQQRDASLNSQEQYGRFSSHWIKLNNVAAKHSTTLVPSQLPIPFDSCNS